jgi:hypothetical protein
MGPVGERVLARILADTGRFTRDWPPQRSKSGAEARSDLWIGELGDPGLRGGGAGDAPGWGHQVPAAPDRDP